MHSNKAQATILRDNGYSYVMIENELGIARGTLHGWFKDRPFTPNQETLTRISRGHSTLANRRKSERLTNIENLRRLGANEIGEISKRDLMMIGIGLWIGEGSKTTEQLRLANSDPRVISFWLRWLRETQHLQDDQITLRMHLYSDSDEEASMVFWQKITGLSSRQFLKTQFDSRTNKSYSKQGKLPYVQLKIKVIGRHSFHTKTILGL